jgi:hypothetical protein
LRVDLITNTQVLAKKPFKKVEVQLDCNGVMIRATEIFRHNDSLDDLKHELINKGYKINWTVYQELLKLNWF